MHTGDLPLDGDHLALDFLNTAPEPEGRRPDLIAAPDRVMAWLSRAGLASPQDGRRLAESPPLGRILTTEARALREALGEAMDAFARGTVLPEPAFFALNRVLDARRVGVRAEPTGVTAALRETAELRFPLGLLTPVAVAAVELLATGDRGRLRQCAAEGCGLWFYDSSRNGRRRWCSMARCGNRAKVAAHYRRHRAGSPGG
ncbi:MAG: CGNR zinc finger domain-containing protein [Longimicrobiales bacterium]|nr:CGNR zinc finger domain-containing protein [Longimicrobiales bacterium]